MAFIKERSLATLLTELKKWVATKAEAVFSVNGIMPEDGDVAISQVEYAGNLISDGVQTSAGEYAARTSGGAASIDDGDAWLVRLTGRRTHTGVVPEVLEMTVNAAPRPEPEEGDPDPGTITAVIDKAVFRAYVDGSGTTTLEYTSDWSEDPTLYGITVSGTPINGDEIVIQYTKEDRGTITQSTPTRFISEGWNLYNSVTGYAKVIKYSEAYGFRIVGDYTGLKYSETVEGTKTTIAVVDGLFSVPGDGFVWVEGGSAANTAIWMAWGDWTDAYVGDFTPYTVDTIDLTTIMQQRFPNGLMQAGSAADIIDLNTQTATSWIERLVYTDQNIADIQASGREYEADENYIYAVRQTPVTHAITIDGGYTVSDHGIEIIDGTTVPVFAETLYGNNLKNKLERDVLRELWLEQYAEGGELLVAHVAAVEGGIVLVVLVDHVELVGDALFEEGIVPDESAAPLVHLRRVAGVDGVHRAAAGVAVAVAEDVAAVVIEGEGVEFRRVGGVEGELDHVGVAAARTDVGRAVEERAVEAEHGVPALEEVLPGSRRTRRRGPCPGTRGCRVSLRRGSCRSGTSVSRRSR